MDEMNADVKMMTMEELAPLMRRKKRFPPIIFLLIIIFAALLGMYLLHSTGGIVITPVNSTAENTTIPVKVIVCDHDNVCDTGENSADCPYDCIASTGLSAARSNDSNITDTTPTVTIKMQDPYGIQSCGASPTDSLQWDCVVREPGEIVTDVDCTLKNYDLDGKYMLILRCKNNNGGDVTPVMMDNIIICADKLGCKR